MQQDSERRDPTRTVGLWLVRYGIALVMVLAGIVVLVVSPSQFGVDGFALAVGGGLSVLLINLLFRLGASGDLEREQEEAARRYFDEHGEWPEEAERPRGRAWSLAPGVVTPQTEAGASNQPHTPPDPGALNQPQTPADPTATDASSS